MGVRCGLGMALGLLVVGLRGAPSAAQPTTVPPMDALQASKPCTWKRLSYDDIQKLGKYSITMSNDGGWCWIHIRIAVAGLGYKAGPVTVSQPPAHGELVSGAVGDPKEGYVRVAYRPTPSYTGSNSFTVGMSGKVNQVWFSAAITITQ